MEQNQKYCKHCGELIDKDCIICPKCGKQVEELKTATPNQPNIVTNNANTNVNQNTVSGGAPGYGVSSKSRLVALLLCFFLGVLGVHRFYAGKVGSGVLYLCTGGICGIGVIYDLIKILTGTFRDGLGLPIKNW